MPYYVYILRCSDHSFYTGFTTDLKRRLNEHKMGVRSIVKSKRPNKLRAAQFEQYLKSNSGRAFRNRRLI